MFAASAEPGWCLRPFTQDPLHLPSFYKASVEEPGVCPAEFPETGRCLCPHCGTQHVLRSPALLQLELATQLASVQLTHSSSVGRWAGATQDGLCPHAGSCVRSSPRAGTLVPADPRRPPLGPPSPLFTFSREKLTLPCPLAGRAGEPMGRKGGAQV